MTQEKCTKGGQKDGKTGKTDSGNAVIHAVF